MVCDWGWIRSSGGWHDDLSLDPDCDVRNDLPFWTNAPCGLLAKVNGDGEVSVVHGADTAWSRSAIGADNEDYFRVNWLLGHDSGGSGAGGGDGGGSSYPKVADGSCARSPSCTITADEGGAASCLCNVTVVERPVFRVGSELPSRDEVLAQLSIAAFDPTQRGMFDDGVFTRCNASLCSLSSDVAVFMRGESAGDQLFLDEHTVFEVVADEGRRQFYRNVISMVHINGGDDDGDGSNESTATLFSFRNPPAFMSVVEPTVRDAQYETDAVIDHYLSHPNTAPFIATRLIERFGISNPSPRYVEVVSTAFATGKYSYQCRGGACSEDVGVVFGGGVPGSGGDESFGNGTRGDLAATVAAVLLDREARSVELDFDPTYGSLREPMVKLLHLMRSMEFEPAQYYEELNLADASSSRSFGQFVYEAETVFNFFQVGWQRTHSSRRV